MKALVHHVSLFYRNVPFSYILCPLVYLIYNINAFNAKVELRDIVTSGGIFLVLAVLLTLFVLFFKDNRFKLSVLITIAWIVTLFFLNIYSFLVSFGGLKSFLTEGQLMAFMLLILGLITLWVFKTDKKLVTMSFYFNILFSIYFLFEFVQVARNWKNIDSVVAHQVQTRNPEQPFAERPDVYFIIADSYANTENLKKYWRFDNRRFTTFLKTQEFFIIKNSRSNYENTVSSMASMLNMTYLPKQLNLNKTTEPLVVQDSLLSLIQHNEVFQHFESQGYEIFNLSLFQILDHKQYYFNKFHQRKFYNRLLAGTLPLRIFIRFFREDDHEALLHRLEEVAATPSAKPKAVYCHLLLPHFPYVYDSIGRVNVSFSRTYTNANKYLDQLKYTNTLLEKSIAVLRAKAPAAYIILASDHGYKLLDNEAERADETFGNLEALYFPDRNYSSLYDSMSAVNLFNAVFSKLQRKNPRYIDDKSDYFY